MRPLDLSLAAALTLAALGPAQAQDTGTTDSGTTDSGTGDSTSSATAEAPGEELRAAAERYVEGEAVQTMMDQMLSPDVLTDAMRAQFGDQIDDDTMTQLADIAVEELGSIRPAMEQAMVDATAETFTLDEIEAQIAFYETPEGSSVLTKMQPLMASYYTAIGPDLQAAQQRIMERVAEVVPQQQ